MFRFAIRNFRPSYPSRIKSQCPSISKNLCDHSDPDSDAKSKLEKNKKGNSLHEASESTLISHQRTYSKFRRSEFENHHPSGRSSDPLWTRMSGKDFLADRLESSTSIEDVLGIVGEEHSQMRPKHVKKAMHMLKRHLRSPEDIRRSLESPEFRLLCRVALKSMRNFDAKELLTVLNRLIDFRVSPDTRIFKTTVQMLRNVISDFYTESLLILDSVINFDIDKNHPANDDPTIIALRIALPMVLEIKLQSNEFDHNNIKDLITCLRIATSKNLSADIMNKLQSIIENEIERLTPFQHAKVISCLTLPKFTSRSDIDITASEILVSRCIEELTKQVRDADLSKAYQDLVVDLFSKCFEGRRLFPIEFLDLVANSVIQRNPDRRILLSLSKQLQRQNYISVELLDKLCDNLANDVSDGESGNEFRIGVLPSLIAPSHFEPKCGWDRVLTKIYDEKFMSETALTTTFQYLKILESMAMLGKYEERFFSFMEPALTKMSERPVPLGTVGQRLLNINMALAHDDHNLSADCVKNVQNDLNSFVQESIRVLNPIKKHKTIQCSSDLRDSLIKALGGEDFLRSGIWTESGQYLDYVIVLRKGDYPVAIGKEILELDFLENIKLPSECKLLSVLPLDAEDFFRTPEQMRRSVNFRIQIMQKSGFLVLPVVMSNFNSLLKREQIPFLMNGMTASMRDNKQKI